ncbi:MAG TPA: hypothetical protein VJV23_10895 [Candidatus Polarisedimenticolia bacterium]|nr:hypothetical protein [Candidatus Polarisedimenticolia bacterium]
MIGAEAGYAGPGTWSTSFSWRYQESDRHFSGHHEEWHRQAEGSEVINQIHIAELGVTRTFTDRFSISLGIPYFLAQRSQALRDPSLPDNQFGNDPVVQRTETHAQGLGDITVIPRWWVFDPPKHPDYNLALGLGVKLPTGDSNVQDTRQVRVNDPNTTMEPFQVENVVQTVDQSIQPGDGGFGIIADLQGFMRFGSRFAGYLTGTYLSNPENKNGVATFRGGGGALVDGAPGSEAIMSVADQYLGRIGGTWFATDRLGFSLGARWEGVPVHDVIGDSDGFRRPGYAFSIEPGVSYTRGAHTFSLAVPYALHRNRHKSVPDLEVPPRHGDAAFADYVIIAGYFRRLGRGTDGPVSAPAPDAVSRPGGGTP